MAALLKSYTKAGETTSTSSVSTQAWLISEGWTLVATTPIGNVHPKDIPARGSQPFGQGGSAAVGSSGAWVSPGAIIITRVVLSCIGAPAGSALVVAFKKDGVTFATLTIPAGSATTVYANVSISVADLGALWVTATSVGSTTAATDVVAQMDWIAG